MNRALKVTRLQLNKRDISFGVPAFIVLIVLVVSAIISIALQRAGLDPARPEFAVGARQNFGVAWALPGFLVYYGVQAVATTFPFAMALGATRRAYVLGTALANAITATYITAILALMLLIELATGHWWFNIYVLDNYALGAGDIWVLIPVVFIGVLFCTTIGGLFGSIWVRYGNKGPTVLGLLLALVLAALVLIFVPYAQQIFEGFTLARLGWVVAVLIVLALLGTWLSMRRTSVR